SNAMLLYVQDNGNIGVGTATPDASAILDLSNNPTKGIIVPRVNLNSPPALPGDGLMVWNTNSSYGLGIGLYVYDAASASWYRLATGNLSTPGVIANNGLSYAVSGSTTTVKLGGSNITANTNV